jgi:hypothetical protein
MTSLLEVHWRQLFILLIAFAVIGTVIYMPGIQGKYFADDYKFFFSPKPSNPLHFFGNKNPNNSYAYRPLEATFLLFVQTNFDTRTWPIHVTQLALHILISWLVFVWMRRNRFGSQAAILGSLFMLVSQASVSAVAGNDTFSQVASTLFGSACLWFFHSYAHRKETRWLVFSTLSFILTILSKENGVAYVAPIALMAWYANDGGLGTRLKKAIMGMAPFLAVIVLFFALRSAVQVVGVSTEGAKYGIQLGTGTIKNVTMFLLAAFSPASTVDIFVAMRESDFAALIILVAPLLIFLALVFMGLWGSDRRSSALVIGLFGLLILLPMSLFKHVSELYVYNSMPLFAVPVGVGLGQILDRAGRKSTLVFGLTLLLLLISVIQVSAVRTKTRLMAENGERSDVLLGQIVPLARSIPEKGQLMLVNPDVMGIEYSVFLTQGFNVLQSGEHQIRVLAGRNDFGIRIVTQTEFKGITEKQSVLALRLADDGQTVLREL